MTLIKKHLMHSASIGAFCLALAACTVGPDYHKLDSALPAAWQSKASINPNAALQQDWWKHFNDPVLNALIAKASADNIDLKLAEARITEARGNRALSRADFLPTGDVQATGERQGNRLAFPGGDEFGLKKPFNNFQTGFDASWEIDLFGGKRRALEASNAQLESAEASRDDARISLLGEVAATYVDIRGYQQQLAITQNTIASDQTTLRIANERFHAGFDAGIDVTRAQAELEQTQSQLPVYRNLLAQSEFQLDVLLGAQPGAAHAMVAQPENAQGATLNVPVADNSLVFAAPSAVIANRPDIRVAERTLAAATAEQGVAVSKLFPDISISGFFGLLSTDSGQLLNAASKSWSYTGSVLWPILNYGKLSAGIDISKAEKQEALLQYQKSILVALSDVERSYTAYTQEDNHRIALAKVVADNRHAVAISEQRYKEGLSSFIDVLDAKRTLYASESALATSSAQTSHNLIALYKSLGGGWINAAPAPVALVPATQPAAANSPLALTAPVK